MARPIPRPRAACAVSMDFSSACRRSSCFSAPREQLAAGPGAEEGDRRVEQPVDVERVGVLRRGVPVRQHEVPFKQPAYVRRTGAMLDVEPQLAAARPGLILITDKGFAGRQTEADLAARGTTLLRPSRKDEAARHGEPLLKSIRQLIESVNDTLKGQLDLKAQGGRTFEGVAIRVVQRILAMAATIWHNNKTGAPVTRSLIAYDH
jgi:hypothetical protein